ncbi:MAG: hypothetical protein JXA44_13220 [Methanospirillaceae archaeon]|nr:hypothetical protein [Methanospirillaceae archaeon]
MSQGPQVRRAKGACDPFPGEAFQPDTVTTIKTTRRKRMAWVRFRTQSESDDDFLEDWYFEASSDVWQRRARSGSGSVGWVWVGGA